MSEVAVDYDSLNAFGLAGQEQPEEQIFVLSGSQLRAIISQATEPFEARIQDLEDGIEPLKRLMKCRGFVDLQEARGGGCQVGGEEPATTTEPTSLPGAQGSHLQVDKIVALEAENRGLKAALSNLEELRPWIEALSKKLARLEAPKISRKTEARAEKIAKYLKERPDHKATYETLRGHLGIDKRRLLEAIQHLMSMDPGRYGIARFPGDKRGRTLILLPK